MISKKKAQVCKKDVEYLGIRIVEGRHIPQKNIFEKIKYFPDILEDKKQVQRFLGLINYVGKYIERASQKVKIL